MNLYSLHSNPESLYNYELADTTMIDVFWDKYYSARDCYALKEREDVIAQCGRLSALYAVEILHGPFPKGEPAIAADADAVTRYARKATKRRFPGGEPIIIKEHPETVCKYAICVVKGRWPEAESRIATNPVASFNYAVDALRERFPQGEPAILTRRQLWDKYAAIFNASPY